MTQVLPKNTLFSPDTSREMLFALPSTVSHPRGQRAAGGPLPAREPSARALPGGGVSERTGASSSLWLAPRPVLPASVPLSSALRGMVSTLTLFPNACLATHQLTLTLVLNF